MAFRRAAKLGVGFGVGAAGTYMVALGMGMLDPAAEEDRATAALMVRENLPPRKRLIDELKEKKFDVLVVGGGASGVRECGAEES